MRAGVPRRNQQARSSERQVRNGYGIKPPFLRSVPWKALPKHDLPFLDEWRFSGTGLRLMRLYRRSRADVHCSDSVIQPPTGYASSAETSQDPRAEVSIAHALD